jgi:hypothetical protein
MAAEHDRYDELAVGHVLGGLPNADAAAFRSHLTGCRDCRARVAELRDLASDLAAAERDELARARVKTQVARRADGEPAGSPPWEVSVRALAVTLVVLLVGGVGLALWNFHLRDQNARLVDVTRAREAVLEGLATGTVVPASFSDGVTGLVVVDDTHVTVDLANLPGIDASQSLVAWLLGDTPADHYYRDLPPRRVVDGRLAFRDPHRQTDRLVVTVEEGEPGPEPAGRELVSAELTGAGSR